MITNNTLTSLLGNTPPEDFFSNYYGKLPFALQDKALDFVGLINWDYIRRFFAAGHNDCWLASNGRLLEQKDRLLTYEEAKHQFDDQGQSLLIRHAERVDPTLSDLASTLEATFEKPIDIHIYATPAQQEGFAWHYDIEDVFAIQSGGEKEFTIRQNTVNPNPALRPLPKNLHFEKETATTQLRCQLRAGDWLYIPSGWWHKAKAITDSFHLSIGVMAGPDDPKKLSKK